MYIVIRMPVMVSLSSRLLMNINYYIYVLRGIEESLTDYDIELVQFSVTSPASFSKFKRYLADYKVDGIICIEFFEPEYISELLEFGLPLVFLDFPLYTSVLKGRYDVILPESHDAVKSLCTQLIRMEEYRKAKSLLFSICDHGVINLDDPAAEKMIKEAKCPILTYSSQKEADLTASNIHLGAQKVDFDATYQNWTVPAELHIPGDFSVYNALGVIATALTLGLSLLP